MAEVRALGSGRFRHGPVPARRAGRRYMISLILASPFPRRAGDPAGFRRAHHRPSPHNKLVKLFVNIEVMPCPEGVVRPWRAIQIRGRGGAVRIVPAAAGPAACRTAAEPRRGPGAGAHPVARGAAGDAGEARRGGLSEDRRHVVAGCGGRRPGAEHDLGGAAAEPGAPGISPRRAADPARRPGAARRGSWRRRCRRTPRSVSEARPGRLGGEAEALPRPVQGARRVGAAGRTARGRPPPSRCAAGGGRGYGPALRRPPRGCSARAGTAGARHRRGPRAGLRYRTSRPVPPWPRTTAAAMPSPRTARASRSPTPGSGGGGRSESNAQATTRAFAPGCAVQNAQARLSAATPALPPGAATGSRVTPGRRPVHSAIRSYGAGARASVQTQTRASMSPGPRAACRQRPAHQRRQPGRVPARRAGRARPGRAPRAYGRPVAPGAAAPPRPRRRAAGRGRAADGRGTGGVPGEGLLAGDHLLGYGDCGLAQYRHGFTTTSFARRADQSGNGHIESDRWPGMACRSGTLCEARLSEALPSFTARGGGGHGKG